ncbi:AT-hook motif nuclear-localized protein [Heracleum sosnowskyi]|uniref:AT-hook motif nuclear-localized protein n=1 Tax=Heracleum sosnowskyi TaxID=360622 RepID=A0AAD8MIQ1_9APIA|nr:AT-hook motif nuclear-localized protein [Heracleum sosnowskyi]
MDGREGMSPPYYFNREVSGPNPNPGSVFGAGTQPGFKKFSSPNISIQTNAGASERGLSYQAENPFPNFGHGIDIDIGIASGLALSDPSKKKRGRPRKYGPDGTDMSLGLSPMSSNPSPGSGDIMLVEGEKKNRGRPRGSGKKQLLASLGEWMNSSAGKAFTPHVIQIAPGEDIASKILAFAQQRPRALCILSANGSVSSVTLRQPMSSDSALTYEGRFEILCMSGSYLVSEGGPRNRTGGLSVSVCTPDGLVIGGAIGGSLIAASLVQAIVCSFVYDGFKTKTGSQADAKPEQISDFQPNEGSSTPTPLADSHRSFTPNPGKSSCSPSSRPDVRDLNTEIDLAHG